ncbi:MAG: arginine deiminase family protein [bacterium]
MDSEILSVSPQCWSEWESLKVVGICRPAPFAVTTHEEARLVGFRNILDPFRALEAYERLRTVLKDNNIAVFDLCDYLTEEELHLGNQLVNRIYVRDIAGVFGTRLILGVAGADIRIPEFELLQSVLRRFVIPESITITSNDSGNSIEFGDCLILNKDAVIINVGFRTSKREIKRICSLLWECGFEVCGLICLPRDITTAHLDLTCNVIGRDIFVAVHFLCHIPVQVITATGSSYYLMLPDFICHEGFKVIWLPTNSDPRGCINFINLKAKTILTSTNANPLHDLLQGHKINIISVNVDELEKGGGSIRCLTLPLVRSE